MTEDKSLSQELKEQLAELTSPNIAVIGRTGVGKSSLINAVFGFNLADVGAGLPVTQGFRRYPPEGSDNPLPIVIYDSAGYEAAKEQKFVQTILTFLEDKQKEGFEKQIHLAWYVINAASARVETFDRDVIQKINEKKIPVIIVLSQCNRASDREIEGVKKALKTFQFDKVHDVIETAAAPLIKGDTVISAPFGLQELVDKTGEELPKVCTELFIASQIVNVQLKSAAAWKATQIAAASCFAGAAVPIPGSAPAVILASQAGLFVRIAYIYGYQEDAQFLLGVLTPTISSVGTLLSSSIGDLIATIFPPALPILAATYSSYVVAFGLTCMTIFENIEKVEIQGKNKDTVEKYFKEKFRAEFEKNKKLTALDPPS